MVSRTLLFSVMASAALAVAQTAPKPAAHRLAAHPVARTTTAAATPALPPGVPPVTGPVKPLVTLRFQDAVVGTGPLAEPYKIYKVAYAGWLASDGTKFDASADHPAQPVIDHSLQMVKNADGTPKMEPGQPFLFQQGVGKVVPGFDNGFEGMHVGGKRRLFIPWQLAYGAKGHPTGDPKNPGIPAKADLIFDIELVDMMDIPQQPEPPAPAQPAAHPAAAQH